MANPRSSIGIVEPNPGTQVNRTFSLRGGAGLDPSSVNQNQRLAGTPSVFIRFNGHAGVGGTFTIAQNGAWTFTNVTMPASIADGATIHIEGECDAMWTDIRDTGHESFDADPAFTGLDVVLETRPPELTITADYPTDVIPASLPYLAKIHGTTSGALSGINAVVVSVDGRPEFTAENVSGDWAIWRAQFPLDAADHQFLVTARDTRNRHTSQPGAISVHERFEDTDPAIVFGPTIYVRELCDLAKQYVQIGGQSGGVERSVLTTQFHQPYDRLPEAALFDAATAPVDQRRIAVEVLRQSLSTPPPVETDQRLRGLAYEALLRELGTSTAELRLARVADPAARRNLANRMGFDLDGPRPDRLDQVTFSPESVTDLQLETAFGFRSMSRTDPFAAAAGPPSVPAWQQAALRTRWQAEDVAARDGGPRPLPVIDPDHVLSGNLASQQAGEPAHDLWAARKASLQTKSAQIDAAAAAGTTAAFDNVVGVHIGQLDLADLAARDGRGEDISAVIGPLQLDLAPLRYLAGVRALLAGGPLLRSEWVDVRDILVQVGKRRVAGTWRTEEKTAGIVLQPQQFTAAAPAGDASVWRVDPRTHEVWLDTLRVRGTELDLHRRRAQAVVQAAEASVLPIARDTLIELIAGRQTPPEPPAAAAERLTRQLCIDLLADSDLLTTRAEQAAQTLLSALFALRAGRLAIRTGGQAWAIGSEQLFDAEWRWMGSFPTWYAVFTSFAYPENHLFPGTYNRDGLNLAPSDSYLTFLHDLRSERMNPQLARDLADDNVDRSLPAAAPDLQDVLKRLAPRTERHDNADLEHIRTQIAPFYGVTPATDQLLRELFFLVPIALANGLTEIGEYTAALDWYQYAYAFQLPADQRRIFPGLARERDIVSTFDRPAAWPVQGSNPHEVARHRKDAYTRSTLMSIVRCLLAFADNEFVRNTAAANARARTLYESAADLINSPDAAPLAGTGVPFPENPVWAALALQARTGLDKIHRGLNITAALPDVAGRESVLPSQYRYPVLAERAKNLVAIAQQLEAAFLTAAQQADNGTYALLQAGHDLTVAQGMAGEQDLKVEVARIGVEQAGSQRLRAGTQADHYRRLLAGGISQHERDQLFDLGVARDLAIAAGTLKGIGAFIGKPTNILGGLGEIAGGLSQAASLDAQIEGTKAGFERRAQEWQLQQSLALNDVEIARQQTALAETQQRIAAQEQLIAGANLAHAAATADFLATKFTSAELFEWMSTVLNGVYAYFLRQATALARLAQAQLAFERQEPDRGLVQDDYWQGPPSSGAADPTDRRGVTGAARLLADLTRLDQYAFETDRRKLHLTQTLSIAQIAASELQQFRQTGVLTVATPSSLFDREFPGHYLRLVKRAKVSVLALVPPVRGVRGTLSASGISRTVVSRGVFETATLRRDPEAIAFTTAVNAGGLFDQEPDTGLLLPFEGMGVDTVWRLELPKAANPLDYRTISDVLLTIEYTALASAQYREKVVRTIDRTFLGDRTFSVREQFPDVWFDLNDPDGAAHPMRIDLPLTADDFPRHIEEQTVAQLTMFVVRADGFDRELTVTSARHVLPGRTVAATAVTTVGGIVGTRRPGGTPWVTFTGAAPDGEWQFQLTDTPQVRSWFTDGKILDVVVVTTIAGTTPAWT
ncbi:hypothetical protein [Dactylosporangium sp. NPDC005555]|uniref:Tc toxin subunit A-related protein n=1 Tax=Dactylosporangium sp. NPDC005555 TaxID=3154889 RepID=UPI0033B4CA1F